MEALGINLVEEPTFFGLIVSLTAGFVRPLREILGLLDRVETLARQLAADPFAQVGPSGVPAQAVWAEFAGGAGRARSLLVDQRDSFRDAIAEAEARAVARDIERKFTEDPRGELFESPEEA